MDWLSILTRALLVGVFWSQVACSACGTRSEAANKNKNAPAVVAGASKEYAKPVITLPRTVERIALSLRDGTEHNALLSLPEKIRTPLPTIIVLGGFETGEKALSFLRTDLNVIYVTTDYPYKAPKERGFVKDLKQIPVIRDAVCRTDLAIDALIQKLRSDPRVDIEKITFAGVSFGAPFAITAAVRKSEIRGLLLLHAFGRVDLAIARQLVNAWGGWSCPISWLLGQIAWAYLDYNAPEAEVLKLRANQKVLYVYSDADEQLPGKSVETLRKALEKSHAQVTSVKSAGGHVGPGEIEILDELMDISIEWLRAQRLL